MDRNSYRSLDSADVVVFNKGGRDARIELLARGEEVPREFFYGFLDLERAGISAAMMSSSGPIAGFAGSLADFVERAIARLTGLGVRPFSARIASGWLPGAKVAISYTDGFSLSLGLGFPRGRGRAILLGGFQGLGDIEQRAPRTMRWLVRRIIARSLARLDHVFFLGPADRARAIETYGVVPELSSILTFGVDTQFWRPMPVQNRDEFVLAIGQDLNRDFDLLARAPGANPTLIITRNAVRVPPDASHIRISPGGYSDPHSATDKDLRRLYNEATVVVVPLKDVYQPSGQSVTLQAMSCGRPIILSKTRGIWAPDLMIDGKNCILVPPDDAAALGAAIGRIRSDSTLARELGHAARETAVEHFGLDKTGAGTVSLARLGLSIWSERNEAGSARRRPEIA
jgi:hypothetical protein